MQNYKSMSRTTHYNGVYKLIQTPCNTFIGSVTFPSNYQNKKKNIKI